MFTSNIYFYLYKSKYSLTTRITLRVFLGSYEILKVFECPVTVWPLLIEDQGG